MKKYKLLSLALILVMLVSALNLFGLNQIRTATGSPQNTMTLPFQTGFENQEAHGRASSTPNTQLIDWQTGNFAGYNGAGSPSLYLGTASITPPSNGYTFLNTQLIAEGDFLGSGAYCYFSLFDQTSSSDYGPPIQVLSDTCISVWYCHTTDARCCMIDGELHNVRTGQVWTLRDFTPDGVHFIVDQNNVRIHPAARRYDSVGTWNWSSFDLSMIYNNDPGNWYITKIWVGFDNDNRFNVDGGPIRTGPARTYFDILQITYGQATSETVTFNQDGIQNNPVYCQSSVSVVADHWATAPQGTGYAYDLFLKANFISNSSGPLQNWDVPRYSNVNITNYSTAYPWPATKPVANGINLDTHKTDTNPPYKEWATWGFDGMMLALSAPTLGLSDVTLIIIQAGELAYELGGMLSSSSKPTYTYTWAQANPIWYPAPPSMTAGQVYIDVPIKSSGTYTFSIDFTTEFDCTYDSNPPNGMFVFQKDGTVPNHIGLTFTTPDINPNPSGGPPSVGLSNPSAGGTFGVISHIGNPNANDCSMKVSLDGQGSSAWLPQGTVQIAYWGSLWCPQVFPLPPNLVWVVIGIGNTALDAATNYINLLGITMQPACPGLPYGNTFNFAANSYSSGAYNFYGAVAFTDNRQDALTYYNNNPTARFQVGTATIGVPYVHAPGLMFTFSAYVCPAFPYLLQKQTLNGQQGYVFTELNNSADTGTFFGGWQSMVSSGNITQAVEDGGNFTYSYNFASLQVNTYYHLIINATGTNGKTQATDMLIYYYDNPPNTLTLSAGTTPQYVYTNYLFSASATDPDGDNVTYTFNWGDGTKWTSSSLTSGTIYTVGHQWAVPATYVVNVTATDPYGLTRISQNLYVTVGQNDAGQGKDAGSNQSSALSIGSTGSYCGTLYDGSKYGVTDTDDWYNFTCDTAGKEIDFSVGTYSGSTLYTNITLYGPNGKVQGPIGPSQYPYITWVATISGNYSVDVKLISGWGQYGFSTFVGIHTPGGCPVLSYFDGQEYRCEGLLPIHNPDGTDIVTSKTLYGPPKNVNGFYLFQLTEDVQTISHIDQVKLYAVLDNGATLNLPLLYAWHSEYGNVLPQLLFADAWRTVEYGANHNNGVSQSIQLKFLALPPNVKIKCFIFQIKGCNTIIKN